MLVYYIILSCGCNQLPVMTYREKIQEMISQIDKLYDDANWLRDLATIEEKKYWNEFRGNFFDASQPLRKLDDNMTDSRGMTQI